MRRYRVAVEIEAGDPGFHEAVIVANHQIGEQILSENLAIHWKCESLLHSAPRAIVFSSSTNEQTIRLANQKKSVQLLRDDAPEHISVEVVPNHEPGTEVGLRVALRACEAMTSPPKFSRLTITTDCGSITVPVLVSGTKAAPGK